MKQFILSLLILATINSCKKAVKTEITIETIPEVEEWIHLTNEENAENWRAYNGESLPPGWTISDGILNFDTELKSEEEYVGGTDVIYGTEQFENFELYVEWKIPKGANSGIFYHIQEGYKLPQVTAPEYQIIDDVNYAAMNEGLAEYNKSVGFENPSQLHPLQQTASDYAMYAADPKTKILNPIGEWNSTKIIFTPEKVEYWLNGKITVSFVPWNEDWQSRKDAGKWDDAEAYGSFKTGFIGFQDHGGPISFRNVKIKKL